MIAAPASPIAQPLGERFRADPAKGIASPDAPRIERAAGHYGAGLIRGAAVLTRGEAQGHKMWVDRTMLEQAVQHLNAAPNGLKARFTHPSLSSDGLGTTLGRWHSARLDGDVVRADLHLLPAAAEAPDGNLAEYVLALAEQDPEAFGTSIVFERDKGAEDLFAMTYRDAEGVFRSPDSDNRRHYKHARIARLRAADAVDEPAANPAGLFHRQTLAHEAEALAAYALGLTEQPPELVELDADPERIAAFFRRFLVQHGLRLVPLAQAPADPPAASAAPAAEAPAPPPSPAELRAELSRYVAAFGAEQGAAWWTEGLAWAEALGRHNAALQGVIDQREAELTRLRAAAAGFDRGEPAPVSLSDDSAPSDAALDRYAHLGPRLARVAAGIKFSA